MSKSVLRRMQVTYGKEDGKYWYAVWKYDGGGEPHRVHSEIQGDKVILRNVNDVELAVVEVDVAKSSKRTTKRKSVRVDSKPEQLADSSD